MAGDQYGLTKKYFSIDESVIEAQKRITRMRLHFYSNNFFTRQEYKGDDQQTTKAFHQDTEVARLVDSMARVQTRIAKMNAKKRYLDRYIHTLPPDEQTYITKKYICGQSISTNELVESSLMEEIHEIEEAVQWIFKEEVELVTPASLSKKGFEDNFKDVLLMLGGG